MKPRRPAFSGAAGAGFSLVELITVIALLGILAAVVMPRFADTRGYGDILLKDQLIATAGFARQAALGRPHQTVTLTLSRPDEWLFEVRADGIPIKQQRVEGSPESLRLVAPLSIVIHTTPVVVDYDELGSLTALNDQPPAANLVFAAGGRVPCLSLAGHAYEAASSDDCALN